MPSSLWALLQGDIRREVEAGGSRSALVALYQIIFNRSLHILYIFRVFHVLHRTLSRHRWMWVLARPPFEVAYRVLTFFFYSFRGVELPYLVRAGSGLRLVHPYNIVLTPQTVLGEGCTIFNGVTCGVNHLDRSGYPVIGSHVVLYPGVKVVGNVRIGDTVVIGANAVVTRSIESNSIAVGMPAVVKKRLESIDSLQW